MNYEDESIEVDKLLLELKEKKCKSVKELKKRREFEKASLEYEQKLLNNFMCNI